MKRLCIVVLVPLLLLSCAYAISKETRATVVSDVLFKDVKADIEKYKGSTFIWGGFIVATKSTDKGTWIEVVQNPINRYGGITDTDISEGRFLAFYKGHLDPLIYEKGRLVTVAGELTGNRKSANKEFAYIYPVLEIKEIYLWKDEIIPGFSYNYWRPSWWYDPWWYGLYYPPPP